jgi:hypothetical protein
VKTWVHTEDRDELWSILSVVPCWKCGRDIEHRDDAVVETVHPDYGPGEGSIGLVHPQCKATAHDVAVMRLNAVMILGFCDLAFEPVDRTITRSS